MKRSAQLLIGAASTLAIAALPLKLELAAYGLFEPASAMAKNGNGNGGGNGPATVVAMAAERVTRASTANPALAVATASPASASDRTR